MRARMIGVLASVAVLVSSAAGQTQYHDFKLLASDGGGWELFGSSVSVSGDTAAIGAPYDYDNSPYAGSAYAFVRSGDVWIEQAKFMPADGAEEDYLGTSVSVDGDTLIAGAYGDDDNGAESGSAYVFVRNAGVWTQQAKLTPSDGQPGDEFGISVAVSGDVAVIGAHLDDDNGSDAGSAYVFVRNGGVWTQQAKLLPDDGYQGDYFGCAVAVSGETTVVGAYRDDDNDYESGSIYVFVREGNDWTQQAKILPDDGYFFDYFGQAVSIDGETIVAGAPRESNIGAAYAFKRDGTAWLQQSKMVPDDGAAPDQFGFAVSVSGDDAVIGSWFANHSGEDSGAAYAFKRVGAVWAQNATLLPSDGEANVNFGCSAAVSDGTAVVGARYEREYHPYAGAAYIFGLCRVDFNGDGTVNTQDFLAYLNAFVAGDLSADFNGDGVVNTQDFLAFLNAFVAGC